MGREGMVPMRSAVISHAGGYRSPGQARAQPAAGPSPLVSPQPCISLAESEHYIFRAPQNIPPHAPPTSPLLLPVPTRLSTSHHSNEFCPASEPCTMPRLHRSAATRASKRGQRSFAASHRSGGAAERRREEKSMRTKLNHLHRHLIPD